MTDTRLLFAAARGARIQYKGSKPPHWPEALAMPLLGADPREWHERRIHPDDIHLAYGPISTAVRANARDGECNGAIYTAPYGSYWLPMFEAIAMTASDDLTRSLFLLILSEALSDEGL